MYRIKIMRKDNYIFNELVETNDPFNTAVSLFEMFNEKDLQPTGFDYSYDS